MMRNFNARRLHRLVIDDPYQVNFFEKDLSDEDELTNQNLDTERGDCVETSMNPANDISLIRKAVILPAIYRFTIP
jgi:hypothetical protein